MNQSENGGVWRWLGRFALDAGSEVLLHASDNGVVVADGIRIEKEGILVGHRHTTGLTLQPSPSAPAPG